ncbi:MAG: ketoacyl-ACP synthase III [Deltaproteobacteria bacterium]|nr:ketoacyl-ACP synthase III [Deltaproteobacteria bacterium]
MANPVASKIIGTGHYVPPTVVTNDDLAKRFDTSDEWIQQRTGIKERRYSKPEDTTAHMGALAARAAVEDAGLELTDIDCILLGTLSPDVTFPGSSVFVQRELGLHGIACMDIRNQCSAYLYMVATADAYVRAGLFKNVLIIGSEVHSTGIDFSDEGRDVTVLFGDGAAAAVISASDDPKVGVLQSCLHADGAGAELLWIQNPGSREFPHRAPESMYEDKSVYPGMDGRAVFKWATRKLPEVIREALDKSGYELDDIDVLVPHQANMRINQMVAKQLGFPQEKVVHNIQKYGNTTAASVGIALDEARKDGRIKEGSLVCLAAFGSGFTWGASILRF